MFATTMTVLLSPITFLVIGMAVAIYARAKNAFGESTGLLMAAMMFLSIPVILVSGTLYLVLPTAASMVALRVLAVSLSFAVTTFAMDRKGA